MTQYKPFAYSDTILEGVIVSEYVCLSLYVVFILQWLFTGYQVQDQAGLGQGGQHQVPRGQTAEAGASPEAWHRPQVPLLWVRLPAGKPILVQVTYICSVN